MRQEPEKRMAALMAAKPDFALRLLFFSIVLLGIFLLVKFGIRGYMKYQSYRIQTEILPAPFDGMKLSQKPLSIGEAGTWLATSFELGQSYAAFAEEHDVLPEKGIIDFYPVGVFAARQQRVVEAVEEYLSVFFCRDVRRGTEISDEDIPAGGRRRHPYEGHQQYHTVFFLDSLLPRLKGNDSLFGVALTDVDLFPRDTWSFVFGQASPENASAVASIDRFDVAYVNEEEFLRAVLRTVSHEAAHALDLRHCIANVCLMNGSMDIIEAESKPLWLCPSCLAKLSYSTSCSPIRRLQSLHRFYRKYGLHYEAENTLARLSLIPD